MCCGVLGGAEVQRDSVTAGSQPPLARVARSNGEKLLRSLSEREFAGDAAWRGDGGQTTEEETGPAQFAGLGSRVGVLGNQKERLLKSYFLCH